MRTIRAFVAVLISGELREKIAGVQEQVKKLAPDVRWVAPDNLHVTLKFLGGVPEDDIARVFAAVEDATAAFAPFDLSFAGVGAFPNPARARVVWVGMDQGVDELRALAADVDARLARLGFPSEDRGFKAHVTIGRVKEGGRLPREFARGIGEIDARDLGIQRVASVAVMQSELQREGPVYTPLSESKLGETT